MQMVYAPMYAALLGGALLTIQMMLMVSAGTYRSAIKKGVGVEGDQKLERLVRRHGNLSENAAIFVVVLALYELLFGQTTLALSSAGIFFIARLLHIAGFASEAGSHLVNAKGAGKKFILMRASGSGLTAISSWVLGIALLVNVFTAH